MARTTISRTTLVLVVLLGLVAYVELAHGQGATHHLTASNAAPDRASFLLAARGKTTIRQHWRY